MAECTPYMPCAHEEELFVWTESWWLEIDCACLRVQKEEEEMEESCCTALTDSQFVFTPSLYDLHGGDVLDDVVFYCDQRVLSIP